MGLAVRTLMPDTSKPFTFIQADQAGYSPGYDVRAVPTAWNGA